MSGLQSEAQRRSLGGKIQIGQRWKDRVALFVRYDKAPSADRFRPDRLGLGVEIIPKAKAAPFIESHHYLASTPQTIACYGLFRVTPTGTKKLEGVLTMSNLIHGEVKYGVKASSGVELSRLVLLDEVEPGAESWFMGEVFEQFVPFYEESTTTPSGSPRRPAKLDLIVSHSDPIPVKDISGRVILPGHIGNIYQARNALYVGRSRSGDRYLTPEGRNLSARNDSKMVAYRRVHRGESYGADEKNARGGLEAIRRVDAMAPGFERRFLNGKESPKELLQRMIRKGETSVRVVPHPGNLVYAWALGNRRQRAATEARLPAPDIEAWMQQMLLPERTVERQQVRTRRREPDIRERLLYPAHPIPPTPTRGEVGDWFDEAPLEVRQPGDWWVNLLRTERDNGARSLWEDASWRGLTVWLSMMSGNITGHDILSWAKANPYPKRPRQRYITILRRIDRLMSQGEVDQIQDLAHELLHVWSNLDPADQATLTEAGVEPPQLSIGLRCSTGSKNGKAKMNSMAALRVAYCENPSMAAQK